MALRQMPAPCRQTRARGSPGHTPQWGATPAPLCGGEHDRCHVGAANLAVETALPPQKLLRNMRSAHVSSSVANLAELVEGGPGNPLMKPGSSSALSADSSGARSEDRPDRLIIVSNQLPVRMKRREGPPPTGAAAHSWEFEWDEDSLVGQAKAGIEQPQFQAIQVLYVGGLPHEVAGPEQDSVSSDLFSRFCCLPGACTTRTGDCVSILTQRRLSVRLRMCRTRRTLSLRRLPPYDAQCTWGLS